MQKRSNIRKAEENRLYSSNGKELEDKIIEIFYRSGNNKKIPCEFLAKEIFSLKKKGKSHHVNTVKSCWRKYTEQGEPEKKS